MERRNLRNFSPEALSETATLWPGCQDETETWLASVKDKKSAYGNMRIAIGGKTDDKDEGEGEATSWISGILVLGLKFRGLGSRG